MGKVLSAVMKKLSADGPKRILMLGLDNAGKTTILYRMKKTEDFNTVPTIGKFDLPRAKNSLGSMQVSTWKRSLRAEESR